MIKLYNKIVLLFCIILITLVIVSCITFSKSGAPVEAATMEKVTLENTKGTIGVGSSSEYLNLKNANNEITVKEYPVTAFEFGAKYFEGNLYVLSKTYYLNQSYSDNSLEYYLIRNPYPCTTPITYASSDETIATIDCTGVVTPIREGIVEITANCGSFSDTMQAIINVY